jgi:hypothetical protein
MRFIELDYEGKTLLAANDYYKIDGIRMPVDYPTAESIVERWGCFLPSPEIVDFIWESADVKLAPLPMKPNDAMTTLDYFQRHDKAIERQLREKDKNKLIAGHKKDIVKTHRPGRVAIYGWHRLNGEPIQPYSTVHGAYYKDYSHGLRLVKWK